MPPPASPCWRCVGLVGHPYDTRFRTPCVYPRCLENVMTTSTAHCVPKLGQLQVSPARRHNPLPSPTRSNLVGRAVPAMLLILLAGAGPCSSGAQSTAARGLPDLPPQSPTAAYDELGEHVGRGDIDTLVELVRSGSKPAQTAAAWALVTSEVTSARVIARAGAIEPLVALLSGDNAGAQEAAAAALGNLAFDEADNTLAIARAGAIEPLVALLRVGSVRAQEEAASALRNLAAIRPNCVAIARAGAIEPLVALVRGGSAMAQQHAAAALGNLVISPTYQVVIAREGAIEPLVALMRDGSPQAQIEATYALYFLAAQNTENQAAIVQANAIGPLLELARGGNAEAQGDYGPGALLDILAIENKMAFMWADAPIPWSLQTIVYDLLTIVAGALLTYMVYLYGLLTYSRWTARPRLLLTSMIAGALLTYRSMIAIVAGALLIYMVYSWWTARPRAKQVRRPEKDAADRRRRRQAGAAVETTQDTAQAQTNTARAEVAAAKHKAGKAAANAMTAAKKAAAVAKANTNAMIAAEKAAAKAATKAAAAKAAAEKATAKAAAEKAAAEKATASAKAAAEKAVAERVVAAATAAVPLDRPPSLPVTSLAAAQFDTGRPESTIGGQTTCIVCFVNPKTHAAVPCGHLCACGECSARLRECPVCRASGVSWFHVHLA